MANTPSVTDTVFGKLSDDRPVHQYTLKNAGIEVRLLNYGGIVTHLFAPDRDGKLADIVLGFDELKPYLTDSPYFGAIIGRFGNRIAKGRFELNGQQFQLEQNDGKNHLHGGKEGFDKKLWESQSFNDESGVGVELKLVSPDGDQGYPGELEVTVVYTLTKEAELLIDYRAKTDKTTIVNLTHHSYFNLAGKGDVLEHQLELNASQYTPVEKDLIPTGEYAYVGDTPFDFREPRAIGDQIDADDAQLKAANGGYDHNFVVNRGGKKGLVLAARASEPKSGRVLEVYTEEPGFQFYSGNFLDGSIKGKGRKFPRHGGFCIEPQHFPDAPNHAQFLFTELRPGQVYSTKTSFRFTSE